MSYTHANNIENLKFELTLESGQVFGNIFCIDTQEIGKLFINSLISRNRILNNSTSFIFNDILLHIQVFYITFIIPHIIYKDFDVLNTIFEDTNLESITFSDPDFDLQCDTEIEVFNARYDPELIARLNEPDTSIIITFAYSVHAWDYIINGTIHPGG